MKVDILGMQAFLSIAEHGVFQRAAASLNISQTALSHRIKKFEESIGVKLVARTTRKVELTKAGMGFLPKVRYALEECSSCLREIRALGIRGSEFVSFGCLPTLALHLLPRSLKEFTAGHPAVTLRVFDRSAPQIVEMVRSGAIEFGLTFIPATGPDLEARPIRKSRFVVVCPRTHEIALRTSILPADLAEVPLIRLGQGDVAHLMLEEALGLRHGNLRWLYEVQQAATAIRMVGAGLGVAILPSFGVDPEHDRDVTTVPLSHPRLAITLGILSRRHVPFSPAAEALVGHLQKSVREHRGWEA